MRLVHLRLLLAAAAASVLGANCALARPPQEAPRPADESKPAPSAAADEAKPDPAPSIPAPPQKVMPREPAGLLRVAGGKVTLGISRKDFQALVAGTKLGRKGKLAESGIEEEVSPCVGEHTVVLSPFWIGKYEVTNAQYNLFLLQAGRVEVVVPPAGQPGPRTLEEIAKSHLIHEKIALRGGGFFLPQAVPWEGLYDLNEAVLAPPGKDNPPREAFRTLILPAGTRLVAYRHTIPETWKVRVVVGEKEEKKEVIKVRDTFPVGSGDHPVTGVSLMDAVACARFFGCHIPREEEWEAACRSPHGEIHPTGEFEPLGMAWNEFNVELGKVKDAARKKKDASRLTERERWALAASELEDPPPVPSVWSVGRFLLGAAPCGALDMLGNADEWVSTRIFGYPGTDSRSSHLVGRNRILRGGTYDDMDTFLNAVYRKFVNDKVIAIQAYNRYTSAGFRMARYHDRPGVSAAAPSADRAEDPDLHILPGEREPRTYLDRYTGLDIQQAMGIDRLDEVVWNAAGSPANDPEDKVFYRGLAYGLALVPPDGIPFRDPSALRAAADKNEIPDPENPRPVTKNPRALPFLGLLYASPGVDIKGQVLVRTKKTVPLSPEELKAVKEDWEARKKAKEEKEKEDSGGGDAGGGGGGDSGGGDAGGGDRKKMPKGSDSKKGGKKGGGKAPPKDPPKDPPKEDPPNVDGSGEPPPEEEEPPEPEEKMPTTKEIEVSSYVAGVVKGSDYPDGFLLGMVKVGPDRRPALYEARMGIAPSDAPGGVVLLEAPIVLLEKDAMEFRKASTPLPPDSRFDTTSGEVRIQVYSPGMAKGDWFEITLNLRLAEFPPVTPATPWRSGLFR